MDEFFKKLRKIQKKERSTGGLARVGDNFYKKVHEYVDQLTKKIDNDPFCTEYYLLRDTQRITMEICEKREHKITDSAVMNVQRSYHLFKGKPKFDLQDTTPLNLTPEEEELYFSLINVIKEYRGKLIPSLQLLSIDGQGIDSNSEISKEEVVIKRTKNEAKKAEMSIKTPHPKLESDVSLRRSMEELFEEDTEAPNKKGVNAYSLKDSEKSLDSLKKQRRKFKTVIIYDELPSIVGVDKNVYGPIYPQDVITLPEANASIIIRNKKGKYIQTYK
ncbi:MAG: hypothetical protein QME14_02005 [Methanobacteriaceae archaeon]|nr:hypothetical protein [Methanobacteriaceae archaeon]